MVGGCVNEYWRKGTLLVHGMRERDISEKVVEKHQGHPDFSEYSQDPSGNPGFQDDPGF